MPEPKDKPKTRGEIQRAFFKKQGNYVKTLQELQRGLEQQNIEAEEKEKLKERLQEFDTFKVEGFSGVSDDIHDQGNQPVCYSFSVATMVRGTLNRLKRLSAVPAHEVLAGMIQDAVDLGKLNVKHGSTVGALRWAVKELKDARLKLRKVTDFTEIVHILRTNRRALAMSFGLTEAQWVAFKKIFKDDATRNIALDRKKFDNMVAEVVREKKLEKGEAWEDNFGGRHSVVATEFARETIKIKNSWGGKVGCKGYNYVEYNVIWDASKLRTEEGKRLYDVVFWDLLGEEEFNGIGGQQDAEGDSDGESFEASGSGMQSGVFGDDEVGHDSPNQDWKDKLNSMQDWELPDTAAEAKKLDLPDVATVRAFLESDQWTAPDDEKASSKDTILKACLLRDAETTTAAVAQPQSNASAGTEPNAVTKNRKATKKSGTSANTEPEFREEKGKGGINNESGHLHRFSKENIIMTGMPRKKNVAAFESVEEHETSFGVEVEYHRATLPNVQSGETVDLAQTKICSCGSEGSKPLLKFVTEAGRDRQQIVEGVYAPIKATEESLAFVISSISLSQNAFKKHGLNKDMMRLLNTAAEENYGKDVEFHCKKDVESAQFRALDKGIETMIQISLDVAQDKVMKLWTLSCSLSARIMGQVAEDVAKSIASEFNNQLNMDFGAEFIGFLSQLMLNSFIMGLDVGAEKKSGNVRKNVPGILVRASLQDQLLATMTKDAGTNSGKVTKENLKKFDQFFDTNKQKEVSQSMLDQVRTLMENLKDKKKLGEQQSQAIEHLLCAMEVPQTESKKLDWYTQVLGSFVNADVETKPMELFKDAISQKSDKIFTRLNRDFKEIYKGPSGRVVMMADVDEKAALVFQPFFNSTCKQLCVVAETRTDLASEIGKSDFPVALLRYIATHTGADYEEGVKMFLRLVSYLSGEVSSSD